MASTLSPEDSIPLIKANLAEVLNPEIIDNVVLNEKRPLKVYWGTATTGKPHYSPVKVKKAPNDRGDPAKRATAAAARKAQQAASSESPSTEETLKDLKVSE